MRVQTNGLPDHCYSVLNTERVKTTVIDYSVKFNIAAPTSGLKTYASQTAFDNEACLSTKSKFGTASPHTLCAYTQTALAGTITPQISSAMMDTVVGVALNGVLIMSSSSGFHDPYNPKTWTLTSPTPSSLKTAPATAESVDSCLGRTNSAGNYHYKMLTPCILEAINVE